MRMRLVTIIGLTLFAVSARPARAQDLSWQNQWYWGTQGGAYVFRAAGGDQMGISAGGHWFITAGRSALYFAFDQLFLPSIASQTLNSGHLVNFGSGQRIQATIYAVPTDSKVQVFLGGGFAIHRITDATLASGVTSSRIQADINDASTKAFLVISGGVQTRILGRWALFGQYQFMPAADDFVIRSQQHSFNAGIRYALTHAEEVVSTER